MPPLFMMRSCGGTLEPSTHNDKMKIGEKKYVKTHRIRKEQRGAGGGGGREGENNTRTRPRSRDGGGGDES